MICKLYSAFLFIVVLSSHLKVKSICQCNLFNAMSAFNVTKDICVATKFIEGKTNEIPTEPELIKMLDLANTISTFDTLNTQEKTIEAIIKQHGNYVAAVKGNQANLYNDIKQYFENKECYEEAKEESYYEEKEKAHNSM